MRATVSAVKRRPSAAAEARRRVDRLRALRNSPDQLHEFALEVLADEGNPDIIKLALESIGDRVRPSDGPVLRALYADFDEDGAKRDPGGTVRVEVLRSLWHLKSREDVELALHARDTVERTLQSNGEMIRAAGLALLGVLEPGRAALEAALVLGRDDADILRASSTVTGEPALTAVRLLANLGETTALLLYALSGKAPTSEVVGEALRGIAGLDPNIIRPMLVSLVHQEDDGLLMAVCDVLVEMAPDPENAALVYQLLESPSRGEVYEFLVTSIVASRRQDLIEMVLETLPREMSRKRLAAALEALRLAPRTPSVERAIAGLERRVARQ